MAGVNGRRYNLASSQWSVELLASCSKQVLLNIEVIMVQQLICSWIPKVYWNNKENNRLQGVVGVVQVYP